MMCVQHNFHHDYCSLLSPRGISRALLLFEKAWLCQRDPKEMLWVLSSPETRCRAWHHHTGWVDSKVMGGCTAPAQLYYAAVEALDRGELPKPGLSELEVVVPPGEFLAVRLQLTSHFSFFFPSVQKLCKVYF